MNTIQIVVASVVAVAVGSYIVYNIRRSNAREKRLFSYLKQMADEAGCQISFYDHYNAVFIGLDSSRRTLFFIRNSGNPVKEVIHLDEVSKCHLHKEIRKVKTNKTVTTVIDKIELLFTMRGKQEPKSLEMYNVNYDPVTLTGELQIANEWESLLNKILTGRGLSIGKSRKLHWEEPLSTPRAV